MPEVGVDFGAKFEAGSTAAMMACQNGHAEMVKILNANVALTSAPRLKTDGYTAVAVLPEQVGF